MLILHHYPMSPFSEKIRLMLGYAGLSWQSLPSPEVPPRPNIDPLSGGYRRIPIAQAGADIFCDSRLISTEIARDSSLPSLDPLGMDEAGQTYAAHLEGEVFWASVLAMGLGVTVKQLLRNVGLRRTLKFLKDRAGVGGNARVALPKVGGSKSIFNAHLQELEERLDAGFLGGDAPSYLDFAAYHTYWFQRVVGELPLTVDVPSVQAWYERMCEFGHGSFEEITDQQGFAMARDNSPRAVEPQHTRDERIGTTVAIGPSDYALDAVEGRLVGCSDDRWIVARETDDHGLLHVHFPRLGFELH